MIRWRQWIVELGLTWRIAGVQTHDQVEAVGSGLAALGLGHQARVGIYGANSPQWMIAMQVRPFPYP